MLTLCQAYERTNQQTSKVEKITSFAEIIIPESDCWLFYPFSVYFLVWPSPSEQTAMWEQLIMIYYLFLRWLPVVIVIVLWAKRDASTRSNTLNFQAVTCCSGGCCTSHDAKKGIHGRDTAILYRFSNAEWHADIWVTFESSRVDTITNGLRVDFFLLQSHILTGKVFPVLLPAYVGKSTPVNTGWSL